MTLTRTTVKECLICDKPLGQESQDLGFQVCHQHRVCLTCKCGLKPTEIDNALLECEEVLETCPTSNRTELLAGLMKHARCAILEKNTPEQDSSVTIKQSYLNHLNNCRLLCGVESSLSIDTNQKQGELAVTTHFSSLTLEEQFIFIAKMEAVIEKALQLTKTNPKTIREKLEQREKEKAKKAQAEALTSSRPTTKPETDQKEAELGYFMQRAGLTDRKAGKLLMKNRYNAINSLVALGATEAEATKQVDADLVKQGRIKAVEQN